MGTETGTAQKTRVDKTSAYCTRERALVAQQGRWASYRLDFFRVLLPVLFMLSCQTISTGLAT